MADSPPAPAIRTTIYGRITDGQTSQAIVGAEVSTSPPTQVVPSDANGGFEISEAHPGGYLVSASKSGYAPRSVSVTVVEGLRNQASIWLLGTGAIVASRLAIVTQPAGAVSGFALTTPPVVELRDASDRRVSDAANQIAVTIFSGTGSLSGSTTVSAANGRAVFAGLKVTGLGPHMLSFTSTGLPTVTSEPFSVDRPSTQSSLSFTVPPSSVGYLLAMTPAVEVTLSQSGGQSASDSVVLTLSSNPVGATLNGGRAAVLNGVATFPNLTLNRAGDGYTISATLASNGSAVAISNTFSVAVPGVVGTGGSQITGLSLVGQTVYFTSAGEPSELYRVSTTGGATVTLASEPGVPWNVVNDGSNLYWEEWTPDISHSLIKKIPIGGGAVTTIATGLRGLVGGITVSGGNVYFSSLIPSGALFQNGDTVFNYAIRRVGVTGGPITDLVTGRFGWPAFTIDNGVMYFIEDSLNTATLRRMPLSGGFSTVLASGLPRGPGGPVIIRRLVVVGSTLYWSDFDVLKSIPTSGGMVSVRATGLRHAAHLVSDGSALFLLDWIDPNDMRLMTLRRYSLADFSTSVLTTTATWVTPVLDGQSVYWADGLNDLNRPKTILKAPK